MEKPVWRMNTGSGVPKDYNGLAYTPKGSKKMDDFPNNWSRDRLWTLNGHREDIYAYQTNRNRQSKFHRVQCDWCVNGYELTGISTCDVCRKCEGHGFYWERIKKRSN
jgi:hypothetical protein